MQPYSVVKQWLGKSAQCIIADSLFCVCVEKLQAPSVANKRAILCGLMACRAHLHFCVDIFAHKKILWREADCYRRWLRCAMCHSVSWRWDFFIKRDAAKSPAALISLRLHNFASNGRKCRFFSNAPACLSLFPIYSASGSAPQLMVFFSLRWNYQRLFANATTASAITEEKVLGIMDSVLIDVYFKARLPACHNFPFGIIYWGGHL